MEIKAGKTYNIFDKHGSGVKRKVHIDFILNNPTIEADWQHIDDYKLVVYRVWLKYKRRWQFYVDPYYILCIYNDWKYNK